MRNVIEAYEKMKRPMVEYFNIVACRDQDEEPQEITLAYAAHQTAAAVIIVMALLLMAFDGIQ